mgnify:CR=1 FL=1
MTREELDQALAENQKLLAELLSHGHRPVMAFDARDRVVKTWRTNGVPCAQVAEGDF